MIPILEKRLNEALEIYSFPYVTNVISLLPFTINRNYVNICGQLTQIETGKKVMHNMDKVF